jgi:hypothetical protein
MATFRRVPSAASSVPDPVDFEAYANAPSHRRADLSGEEAVAHNRSMQIVHKARAREMRVLLSLRHKTAQASKGQTTDNKIENTMRERAEEAVHAAAENHIKQLKRRLSLHAHDYFARADKDWSGTIDLDEWMEAFGTNNVYNPLNDSFVDRQHLRKLFEDLDQDANGEVSIHEFVSGVQQWQGLDEVKKAVESPEPFSPARPSPIRPGARKEGPVTDSPEPLESPYARYRR